MADLVGTALESDVDPTAFELQYEERRIELAAGVAVTIRESNFHAQNANCVWPGTAVLADWLAEHPDAWLGRRLCELGAATGVLAVFLHRLVRHAPWLAQLTEAQRAVAAAPLDLTTSDYADDEIAGAIAHNSALNDVCPAPPHWPHTWGTPLPANLQRFEVIYANDILIYVSQYTNLVATIVALLRHGGPDTVMYLSCQRRITTERDFLALLEAAGGRYTVVGRKIYRIQYQPNDPHASATAGSMPDAANA